MQNQWKAIAAVVVAVIGMLLLGSTLRKGCTHGNRLVMANVDVDVAVAAKLGQEVGQRFEPGKVLVVRFAGYIPSTVDLQNSVVAACAQGLGGRDWTVVELPPEEFGEAAHGNWALHVGGGGWGEEIKTWVAPHADAVAVISLVGIPHLSQADWEKMPPFFAAIPFKTDYAQAVLRKGMVEGLAAMREDTNPVSIREFRGSAKELFDLAYEWLTPAAP